MGELRSLPHTTVRLPRPPIQSWPGGQCGRDTDVAYWRQNKYQGLSLSTAQIVRCSMLLPLEQQFGMVVAMLLALLITVTLLLMATGSVSL